MSPTRVRTQAQAAATLTASNDNRQEPSTSTTILLCIHRRVDQTETATQKGGRESGRRCIECRRGSDARWFERCSWFERAGPGRTAWAGQRAHLAAPWWSQRQGSGIIFVYIFFYLRFLPRSYETSYTLDFVSRRTLSKIIRFEANPFQNNAIRGEPFPK